MNWLSTKSSDPCVHVGNHGYILDTQAYDSWLRPGHGGLILVSAPSVTGSARPCSGCGNPFLSFALPDAPSLLVLALGWIISFFVLADFLSDCTCLQQGSWSRLVVSAAYSLGRMGTIWVLNTLGGVCLIMVLLVALAQAGGGQFAGTTFRDRNRHRRVLAAFKSLAASEISPRPFSTMREFSTWRSALRSTNCWNCEKLDFRAGL